MVSEFAEGCKLLEDEEGISNLSFLADICFCLCELSLSLQGKDCLVLCTFFSRKRMFCIEIQTSLFFFFFRQVTRGRKLLTPVPWGCAEHKSQVSGGCHPLPSTPKVSPWSTEAVEMLLHCLALHSVQPRASPPALSLLGGKHLLGVLPMPTFVLSQLLVTQHTLTHMLLFASWEKTFWIF